ncbi:MAG: prepilin-type N-terminal cleavage/methylation domain-containing protein [Elusimicrobia bacterium]|nr:prepilin-type N-terminal cleavage/methylation domain-containing protein [Elusimicrobiota bacterium]
MTNRRAGFTLIELLVVVLIIGILAAVAVPQYFKVVEKGKFVESMQWINGLKTAEERYLAKAGNYFAGTVAASTFDVNLGGMKYFVLSQVSGTTTPSWSVTLTRNTPTPAIYGAYVVTYVQPPGSLSCSVQACSDDLLP